MGKVQNEVFNLLHNNYQIADVAKMVQEGFERAGRPIEIHTVPAPANVRDYRLDGSKIETTLNFKPAIGINSAVDRMLREFEGVSHGDLAHPKYSNIEWMTILDDVARQLSNRGQVF
jgi:nucleoside-diphosphate-sugar epimerase